MKVVTSVQKPNKSMKTSETSEYPKLIKKTTTFFWFYVNVEIKYDYILSCFFVPCAGLQ